MAVTPDAIEGFMVLLQSVTTDGFYKQAQKLVEVNRELTEQNKSLETTNQGNMNNIVEFKIQLDDATKQAKAKTQETEQLSKDKSDLARQIEVSTQQAKETKTLLDEASKSKSTLEAELRTIEGIVAGLREALEKETSKVATSKAAERVAKEAALKVQRDLAKAQSTVDNFAALSCRMVKSSEATVEQQLQQFYTSAFHLVKKYFGVDLDEDTIARASELTDAKGRIRLPLINSPYAKHVRVAAILAVLAESLTGNIFQPVYLLKDNELSALLSHLASKDPVREAHLRSVLLAISPELQKKNSNVRVRKTIGEVLEYAGPFLSATKRDSFESSLGQFCRRVCDQWMTLQMLDQIIEAEFGVYDEKQGLDDYDEDDWVSIPMTSAGDKSPNPKVNTPNGTPADSSHSSATAGQSQADMVTKPAVFVWPMFLIWRSHAQARDLVRLTKGYMLSQEHLKAARHEENAATTGSARGARQLSRRERTKSISTTAKPFLPVGSNVGPNGG